MVAITSSRLLSTTLSLFAILSSSLAAAKPLIERPATTAAELDSTRTLDTRQMSVSVVEKPKMVIYTDSYISNGVGGLPSADDLDGYNVLILAFYIVKGPADQAEAWKELSSSDRKDLLQQYNDKGITVLLSALGSTEQPTTDGVDPSDFAKECADFVKKYDLAGIDVDYEDMPAMDKQNGKAEQWLIDYTNALRKQLPAGNYIITHAPVSPWFSASSYKTGAYVKVHQEAGDSIDWYNMQFYNQGKDAYTDCNGLLFKGPSSFPQSSVFEIHEHGAKVPLNKIVIGKPSQPGQASNGWMSFGDLASCVKDASAKGWSAGTMFWEFDKNLGTDLTDTLSKLIIGLSGDLGLGSSNSTDSGSGDSGSSDGSGDGSDDDGDCDDSGDDSGSSDSGSSDSGSSDSGSSDSGSSSSGTTEAWSSDKVYDGGSLSGDAHTVSYKNACYQNKWWTQGDKPTDSDEWGVWGKVDCSFKKRSLPSAESSSDERPVSRRGNFRKIPSPGDVLAGFAAKREDKDAASPGAVLAGFAKRGDDKPSSSPDAVLAGFAKRDGGNGTIEKRAMRKHVRRATAFGASHHDTRSA